MMINSVYNGHFTGSEIWELFSKESTMFESTYNRSIKISSQLPYETHRYFMEPLSSQIHLKRQLIRKYLCFIERLKVSTKSVLKDLLDITKYDVRTVTGSNMRNILMLTNKTSIDDLKPSDVESMCYHPVPENEHWRVNAVMEIQDLLHGDSLSSPEGWNRGELKCVLNHMCTS